ncbi:MAG: PepSY domain-containing protein [Microlunatus sp.]|nr:PepSY domain-containing protein [Microlunatus sp.]MDN5769378.1 PepSY domain-containing protein [Microlunatus sp.]
MSPNSTAGNAETVLKIGGAAEKAVPDSRLISLESEQDGDVWEAQVVTPDGVEHEMDLSAADATVTSGPTKDEEDADDRAKHRRRLAEVSVDYRGAVKALGSAVPDGTITELDLDSWKDKTVWEADVYDPAGTKHEVKVDATTAEILANEADG